MNVVTLVEFHDNIRDVDRKRGEVFVVSRERFEEINRIGAEKIGRPIVEEVAREEASRTDVQTPESRAASKRRSRKAK